MEELMALLNRDEVAVRIRELEVQLMAFAEVIEVSPDATVDEVLNELDALHWLREAYWLEDEGFLEIGAGDRCYYREQCPSFP